MKPPDCRALNKATYNECKVCGLQRRAFLSRAAPPLAEAVARRRLEVTESALRGFEHALSHQSDPCPSDIDPLLFKAQFDSMVSVAEELRAEAEHLREVVTFLESR